MVPPENHPPTEITTGQCKIHGQCTLWVACKHVAGGKAKKMFLIKPDIALCAVCRSMIEKLEAHDLIGVCETCLRNYIQECLKSAETEEDINRIVVGFEHLGGKDKSN
jgi:hypothetical protein